MFAKFVALVALVLCLTSVATAADLYLPGSPINCTAFRDNCKALTTLTYGGGKDVTFSGPSVQCNATNPTNLPNAKPLCETKVICAATFLTKGAAPAPGTGSAPAGGVFAMTTKDMTDQLISMYDASKCSSASAQAAMSVMALVLVGSIVSFMSSML